MKGASMSFSGPICWVLVLTAAVVCGRDGWEVTCSPSQICALEGSTVEILCSYRYPSRINNKRTVVEKRFWFTTENYGIYQDLKDDQRYSGRVNYQCENNTCTLKISNLRKSDSNVYKFRFTTNHESGKYTGSPGVPLTITDPQVQVKIKVSSNYNQKRIELTCDNKCQLSHPFSYVWFNNQREVMGGKNFPLWTFHATGRYHCAMRGYEHFPSPAVYAPKMPLLSLLPSDEIVKGSEVILTCSSDVNPTAKYTWYRADGAHHVELFRSEPQIVFSSIQTSDSGWYHCKAENDLGSIKAPNVYINVTYRPKICTVSVIPSGKVEEGKPVTLTCSSYANPAAEYTWYKENKILPGGSKQVYRFHAVSSEDSGNYFCKSENQYGHRNSSPLFLDVLYAPKFTSVVIAPPGEIVEGRSVTLTCSSYANPAAEYTWYKENKILPGGSKQVYRFHAVSSEDSGNYFCKSENQYGHRNSSPLFLDVLYAPKFTSVAIAPPGEIVEGRSVTLTCSSDANPAAKYFWYRENNPHPLTSKENLIFNYTESSHSGQYYCTAENNRGEKTSSRVSIDVKYAPRLPSVSLSPSGEIMEGSSVTLTCSSDANPAADYTWYKEGEDSPKASKQNFTISDIQHEHSGNYYCKVQNKIGRRNSTVCVNVVAGPSKLAAIGTTVCIFLIIISLSVFFLLRKRRQSTPSPKRGESPNNIEQSQDDQSESQEDIQYASVRFLKKQRDPIYANFKPAKTGTPHEEEEEEQGVQYAAVIFASSGFDQRTEGSDRGEDSGALYSVINKFQRPKLNN